MYKESILESKKWNDGDWLSYMNWRFEQMDGQRKYYEGEWDLADTQFEALTFYDNEGQLNVNVSLEQTLEEIYQGRSSGSINFDIKPDGQADVEELQASRYAIEHYMEGNGGTQSYYYEDKQFRNLKSHYGTGIMFTGIRCEISKEYDLKDDLELTDIQQVFQDKNYKETEKTEWFFYPKNWHIRHAWFDEDNLGVPNVQLCDDMILLERMSLTEFKLRFSSKIFRNTDKVQAEADDNPRNANDFQNDQQVSVYYYYNRLTKDYVVWTNKTTVIFNSKYLYKDGKLPIVVAQHYQDKNCLYGIGIPKKVRWLKAYKSEMYQNILYGSAIASGMNLVVGNDGEIDQDWTITARNINVWRTNTGAESIVPMNTGNNLGFFTTVLSLLDQEIIETTGENPKASFQVNSDKVGIVEMMEQNKSIRSKSVDENYNEALDAAFTMMLSRLKQFAPYVQVRKTEYDDGKGNKATKMEYPSISVEGVEIKQDKKSGAITVEERLGKYGYFELRPGILKGGGVKVVTPSTTSLLPVLERERMKELANIIQMLGNVMQYSPEAFKQFTEEVDLNGYMERVYDAFGIDQDGFKANTTKDDNREKNAKAMEELAKKIANFSKLNQPNAIPGPDTTETMTNESITTGQPEATAGATNTMGI